jgi:hypothetical protein
MTKTPVHISMSLRVWGDLVIPDEVSKSLGSAPTSSYRKGDIHGGKKTGRTFKNYTGLWRLKSALPRTATFEQHATALLSQVTSDPSIWDRLNDRHKLELFCGVFVLKNSVNQVFDVPAQLTRMLSDRHLAIVFDCYSMNKLRNE